ADDLGRFLKGEPIRARPVPAWRRLWRFARRRPTLLASALAAVLLAALLLTAWSHVRATRQRHAQDRAHQFVQRRDEALVYGLLASDQEALVLSGQLQKAERAAQEALALAGREAIPRRADCYTLLLVLAGIRGQQGRYREALDILEQARQLGYRTRAYHLRRGHFLEQLGEHREARKDREQ